MKIHVSHDKADILEFLKPRPIQLSPPEFGIPVKHTHPDAARVENDRQAPEIGLLRARSGTAWDSGPSPSKADEVSGRARPGG